MSSPKITITASSGKLGRAVAAELAARDLARQVRLSARDPQKIADLKAQGFETIAADYDDGESLKAAFAGSDAIVLISSEGVNEKRIRQHQTAIDAAKAAGVKRIVYTSTTSPSHDSSFEWSGAHVETEAYLKQSGLAYTILRDNSYFSNNDSLFEQAKVSGTLVFPGIDAKVAYVSHEDVAATIAGALTSAGHENKIYEISGREAVSARELAAALSDVTGRTITAVDVPLQAFHDQFKALGLPEYLVTGLTSFYAALGAGEFSSTSNDIERLAGRPSASARDYLKKFV
jgi:NAD(P)H dehydrogenase (quinone)